MALKNQCAEKGSWARRSQTHRTTHSPWLPSRHQDHPFITLRGIGCSSKLPVHSYQNAQTYFQVRARGRSGPKGAIHRLSCGLPPDLAGILPFPSALSQFQPALGHVLLPINKSRTPGGRTGSEQKSLKCVWETCEARPCAPARICRRMCPSKI